MNQEENATGEIQEDEFNDWVVDRMMGIFIKNENDSIEL